MLRFLVGLAMVLLAGSDSVDKFLGDWTAVKVYKQHWVNHFDPFSWSHPVPPSTTTTTSKPPGSECDNTVTVEKILNTICNCDTPVPFVKARSSRVASLGFVMPEVVPLTTDKEITNAFRTCDCLAQLMAARPPDFRTPYANYMDYVRPPRFYSLSDNYMLYNHFMEPMTEGPMKEGPMQPRPPKITVLYARELPSLQELNNFIEGNDRLKNWKGVVLCTKETKNSSNTNI